MFLRDLFEENELAVVFLVERDFELEELVRLHSEEILEGQAINNYFLDRSHSESQHARGKLSFAR